MIKIEKLEQPQILQDNADTWTEAYLLEPDSRTKKYRYRHSEIKGKILEECGSKCMYCESKIGHNTPGDIEHIVPSSKDQSKHFAWDNLGLACTECNRRKSDVWDPSFPILNPYKDDVENMLEHRGPVVFAKSGDERAEISVGILELNDKSRIDLILRKVEKIREINDAVTLYKQADGPLREVRRRDLKNRFMKSACEYAGMARVLLASDLND